MCLLVTDHSASLQIYRDSCDQKHWIILLSWLSTLINRPQNFQTQQHFKRPPLSFKSLHIWGIGDLLHLSVRHLGGQFVWTSFSDDLWAPPWREVASRWGWTWAAFWQSQDTAECFSLLVHSLRVLTEEEAALEPFNGTVHRAWMCKKSKVISYPTKAFSNGFSSNLPKFV